MGYKKSVFSIFFVFFVFFNTNAFSENKVITKEVIVDVEGVIGETENELDFRRRLIESAKEKAIEEVNGSFVKKSSVIVNREAVSVDISTSTKGEVRKLDIVEYITPWNEYHKGKITIKALVISTEHFRDSNMNLDVNINKNKFFNNDEVVLDIKTNFDAYITIINIYEDDSVAILFPNSIMDKNFIKSNNRYKFPSDEMKNKGVSLMVGLPKNKKSTTEHIRIFASKKNVQLFDPDFKENIFKFVDSKDTETISTFFERIYKKIDADEITDKIITYTIVNDK